MPKVTTAAAALGISLLLALGAIAPAYADTSSNGDFEGFTLGDPLGQGGWTANDIPVYNASGFDVEIVDPSAVWTGGELGTRALRVSNAVTSGGFGNQLQSPSLADEAGETAAVNGGMSGGTRQSRFSGSITFASATKMYQPGLVMSFSPDRGDGTRMSYFRISDRPGGLMVEVGWLDNSIPAFVYDVLAQDLDRTQAHTLDFSIDFIDGVGNDVLWARVGGECNSWASSGTWEDYHRYYGGGDTQTVDSILMRLAGTAVPANAGGGFLFDRFDISSSTVAPMPPIGIPGTPDAPDAIVTNGTTTVRGTAVVTNACAPVTQYAVTVIPTGGGTPMTFTSATPDFNFPTPFDGQFDLVMSATNNQGTSPDSALASITSLLGESDGELASTGAADARVALAAALLTLLGVVVLAAGRRRG